MTKMLMLLTVEDSNSRSEMDQNSDSRAIARAKEAQRVVKEKKVVRNHVVTVEPTTHLVSVQHMENTVFSTRKMDISVPTVDPAGTTNSMVIHPQEDLDVNMKWNKITMDWTFSLNHNEVFIKFTDSVPKVKDSKNVMFDEIELSRVLGTSYT